MDRPGRSALREGDMKQFPIRQSEYQKGESLVEVLVALAILLLVLVSILQLFSLSLMSYHSTSAHRDMMRRAQEVVEIIRLVNSTNVTGSSGLLPMAVRTIQLPRKSNDTGWAFWGPAGFNIMEPGSRYTIAVNMADGGADWLVTVFVDPTTTGEHKYLGPVSKKGVRYASRIPK